MRGHLHLREHLAHLSQVQRAGGRQLQASTHASEQQVLDQFFELRHLLADRTLREVQLFGGAGETQVPGHRFETLQRRDGRQVAFVQHIQAC